MTGGKAAVLGGLGFVGLVLAVLWLASQSFLAAQQRLQSYHYLAEALTPVAEPAVSVTWQEPIRPLVRPMTETDRLQVGRALTQAWRAFAAAKDSGQEAVLADHFVGPALDRARLAVREAQGTQSHMVVLEQQAWPAFLHLDGSLLQVETRALTVRFSRAETGTAGEAVAGVKGADMGADGGSYLLTLEDLRTTLTSETTGWRIFSHEREKAEILSTRRARVAVPAGLRGVNYYPAESPWKQFWPNYDPLVVAGDLDRIKSLGADSLRIFLPPADFSADPSGDEALASLESLLLLAQQRQLSVIATLFDLKPGYQTALWAEDVAYLRRLLPVLGRSPAVVLVDLKNEPDLDMPRQAPGLVEAWLRSMARVSRWIAPDLALTIGWSGPQAAGLLAEELDAISYHDYGPVADTAGHLAAVQAMAGGRPVLVTEIGASSFTAGFGLPGSPESQAELLDRRLAALKGAEGVLIWTLHDFDTQAARDIGLSPWGRRLQSRYGLLDRQGAEKPAAAVVRRAFGGPEPLQGP